VLELVPVDPPFDVFPFALRFRKHEEADLSDPGDYMALSPFWYHFKQQVCSSAFIIFNIVLSFLAKWKFSTFVRCSQGGQ
jgi:hypothetical protein